MELMLSMDITMFTGRLYSRITLEWGVHEIRNWLKKPRELLRKRLQRQASNGHLDLVLRFHGMNDGAERMKDLVKRRNCLNSSDHRKCADSRVIHYRVEQVFWRVQNIISETAERRTVQIKATHNWIQPKYEESICQGIYLLSTPVWAVLWYRSAV